VNANERKNQAIEFVNNLVPGRFEQAKAKLSAHCEYHYSGKILKGPAIIQAFEDSHTSAAMQLDHIEYLPATFDANDGIAIVIKVKDRISANKREHTYTDRLAITLEYINENWAVSLIEHRPYSEERLKLKEFLAPLPSS
jgi:hypothetical protein